MGVIFIPVRRAGFEPAKAVPPDLQSGLVDHLSTYANENLANIT